MLEEVIRSFLIKNRTIILCCLFSCFINFVASYTYIRIFLNKETNLSATKKYEEDDTSNIIDKDIETLGDKFIYVDISGGVKAPGVYSMTEDDRIIDAITKSGGFADTANMDWAVKNINLAMKVKDSEKLYIPFIWENAESTESKTILADTYVDSTVPEKILININTASKEDLESLDGIGDKYAEKILTSRPYNDINDFIQRSGLSQSLISKIESEIDFK